jgi:hypothetical protein
VFAGEAFVIDGATSQSQSVEASSAISDHVPSTDFGPGRSVLTLSPEFAVLTKQLGANVLTQPYERYV